MILKYNKVFLRITFLMFLCLSFIASAQSETPSKATALSSTSSFQDIQAAADNINKNVNKYDHYLSHLNEVAKDPGIKSASMLLYYDAAFFKDSSYKKMIIFYFGAGQTLVDEYYPVKNKKYVIRMRLNNSLRQDQLNIESFLQEYNQIRKTILSKAVFVDNRLQMWTDSNSETKKIDDKLTAEGQMLLDRENVAVSSVVMD